jgi:hypothetical protein
MLAASTKADKEEPYVLPFFGAAASAIILSLSSGDDPSICAPTTKRSRKHAFDAVAEGTYEVEAILAERTAKGKPEFLIKWQGYRDEDNTWEPLINLAGLEEKIAAFRTEREKAALAQSEKLLAEKAARKAAAERTQRVGSLPSGATRSAVQASSTVDAPCETAGSVPGSADAPLDLESSEPEADPTAKKFKECSAVYRAFELVAGEQRSYRCTVGNCETVLKHGGGTKAMWNHLQGKHKDTYIELKQYDSVDVTMAEGSDKAQRGQTVLTAAKYSSARKEECDLAVARWLVKSCRPLTLPERDMAYQDHIKSLVGSAWIPPNYRNVTDHVLKLSGKGQSRLADWVRNLSIARIKPSMAGDIWSDRGCSLLGITLYAISKTWKLEEWLVAATPFGTTRHTGDAIDATTLEALRKPGLGSTAEEVYAAVHSKISDNGSNMKKGWIGFGGRFCAAHTIELSVHQFTNARGEFRLLHTHV